VNKKIRNLFRLAKTRNAGLFRILFNCFFDGEVVGWRPLFKKCFRRPVMTAPGETLLT
jgi:hypothetical protein